MREREWRERERETKAIKIVPRRIEPLNQTNITWDNFAALDSISVYYDMIQTDLLKFVLN